MSDENKIKEARLKIKVRSKIKDSCQREHRARKIKEMIEINKGSQDYQYFCYFKIKLMEFII